MNDSLQQQPLETSISPDFFIKQEHWSIINLTQIPRITVIKNRKGWKFFELLLQLCIIYLEIAFHKKSLDYGILKFLQYHLARAPDLQSHHIQEQLESVDWSAQLFSICKSHSLWSSYTTPFLFSTHLSIRKKIKEDQGSFFFIYSALALVFDQLLSTIGKIVFKVSHPFKWNIVDLPSFDRKTQVTRYFPDLAIALTT